MNLKNKSARIKIHVTLTQLLDSLYNISSESQLLRSSAFAFIEIYSLTLFWVEKKSTALPLPPRRKIVISYAWLRTLYLLTRDRQWTGLQGGPGRGINLGGGLAGQRLTLHRKKFHFCIIQTILNKINKKILKKALI